MSSGGRLFRIDPSTQKSEAVKEVDFAELGLQERKDIQEWVAGHPGILGEDLLIIAKEFSRFDKTSERPDLLAVDAAGNLVVIELKRDDSGADAYWQAIKYASYLGRASVEQVIDILADYAKMSKEDAQARLLEHIDPGGLDSLNNNQRIILASHRFAPEVTSAALWLNGKVPGENLITCVQLTPYRDEKMSSLYVQSNTIIPLPGEEDYIVQIGSREIQVGSSSFAEKLNKTYARNQDDEVSRFLKKAADLALRDLQGNVKPDRSSRWAGGWAGGAWDHRYYRVWYNRVPWLNWGMSYGMRLYRRENDSELWKVEVGLEYYYASDELKAELDGRITGLNLHENQEIGEDRLLVTYPSDSLDDGFAGTLAGTLKRFIEAITPIVDEFEGRRSEKGV